MGTYGHSYTLANAANTEIGAKITGPGTAGPYTRQAGTLGYNEVFNKTTTPKTGYWSLRWMLQICEFHKQGGWTTKWSEEQKVPYTYKGNQWAGYDNVESITIKVKAVYFYLD